MRRFASMAAVAVVVCALSTSAMAEESAFKQPHALLDATPQERPQTLSFWIGLPYAYGLGIDLGVRYSIPIVKNGFIPKLNNSFDIEFGGDFQYAGLIYVYPFLGFSGVVGVRWTFYLTPKFAAYGKVGLGVGYAIYTCGTACGVYVNYPYPFIEGGAGIIFHINETFSLRAELGYQGLRGGIGFDF